MNKNTRYFVQIIAYLFLVVGFIGFIAGFITSAFGVKLDNLDSFEFPLGRLEGIAVDSEGNIYCGLHFYSRFQKYDSEGNFIYSKSIDSAGGAFRIRINKDDQLEVATAGNDKFYIFAKNGTLVRELSDVGHYFQNFGKSNEDQFHDKKHNVTYFRKPALLGPYIVKKDSSGYERVIVKIPFHKWLFMGPLPAFFFIMIGGIISSFLKKNSLKHFLKRKQTKKQA